MENKIINTLQELVKELREKNYNVRRYIDRELTEENLNTEWITEVQLVLAQSFQEDNFEVQYLTKANRIEVEIAYSNYKLTPAKLERLNTLFALVEKANKKLESDVLKMCGEKCIEMIRSSKRRTQMNKPVVNLIGENENVFNILGICRRALKDAGQIEKVEEMSSRLKDCHSYDAALAMFGEYVEIWS